MRPGWISRLSAGTGTQRWWFPFALVLAVAAVFACIRSTTPLIWDDSSSLSIFVERNTETRKLDGPAALEAFRSSFAAASADGYRPLSLSIRRLGMQHFASGGSVFLWALPVGALIGLFMLALYATARRLGNSSGFAALAVLLVVGSSPFVASSWIIAAGIQVIVPLFICAALLMYCRLADTGYRSVPLHLALLALFIAGPWFREFIGVAPLLVGLLDLIRRRRPTAVMLIAAIGFLHAVYPGWLVHLFVATAPDLPIYKIGALSRRMTAVAGPLDHQLLEMARQAKLVSAQFLVLIPSTILVMLPVAMLVRNARQTAPATRTQVGEAMPGNLLAGNVVFLAIWTAGSILPLFKVYTEEVHLLYALVPFSILICLGCQHVWRAVTQVERHGSALRAAVGFALLVGIGDQALNFPNSIRIVNAINDGMQQVADRVRQSMPPGSAIVGNALHLEDLRLMSNSHFKPFWTVTAGIPTGRPALATRQQLVEFFQGNRSEVYFLDADYEFHPDKRAYHSHRYVNRAGIEIRKLWETESIRISYPFLDPLKNFVPRPLTNVLFAPDLENDFYRGRARSGTPFMREVYVSHALYKVVRVDP